MNAFKKHGTTSHTNDVFAPNVNEIFVHESKNVKEKNSKSVTTYVTLKKTDTFEVEKKLGMPSSEDYTLEAMLKAGVVPEDVPVRGMLDSSDPLDSKNISIPDAAYAKLSEFVPQDDDEFVPQVDDKTTPTPAEPTNESVVTE